METLAVETKPLHFCWFLLAICFINPGHDVCRSVMYYMYVWSHIWQNRMDQPGKVANPVRGQLNRENEYFIFSCPRSPLRSWSRETGSAVPSRVSLLIFILRLNLVLTYGIPPEFRGGVHLRNRHTPSGQSRVYRVT